VSAAATSALLDAEQALLGAALIDPGALERVAAIIDVRDLHTDDHRAIYRAVQAVAAAGEAPDLVTVAHRLANGADTGQLLAYLGELARNVPSAANVEAYARLVAEAAQRRRLVQAGERLAERAREHGVDLDAAAAEAMEVLSGAETRRERWPAPIDLRALAAHEPEPPAWIVRDWMPAGYATLLAGHGGAGKSGIALHLAVCIALGLPWAGVPVRQRRVLYVSAEDRADVLHWRLARICAHLGVSLDALAGRLDVIDLVGRDAVLWASHVLRTGEPTPAMLALHEAMDATGAKVLIVDGVSDTFAGSEIVRAEVRAYVSTLAGLIPAERGAVLLIAHVDKLAARGGASTERYSGSTAWHNSVRARWELAPERALDDEGAADTGDLLLTLAKSNLGGLGAEIRWRWDEQAHMFTGRAVVAEGELDRRARERRERDGILDAMRAVVSAGDYVPAARQGSRTTYHVLAARPELPESLRGGRGARRRFHALIEQLRAIGEVRECSIARADRHRITTLEPVGSRQDAPCGPAGHCA